CDGWSIGLITEELGAVYEAFHDGLPCPLDPLPIQYADFAIWQKQWIEGGGVDKERTFWRRQLREAPDLEFPTDRPRAPASTFKADIVSKVLPRALTDALQ